MVCGEQNVKALQLARPPLPHHALCKVDERLGLSPLKSFG
jgi:hypothetical protein